MSEHWLDRLARRTVRPPVSLATEPLPSTGDERYSRGRAVKLAVVGAATLAVGIWRPTPGHAGDYGDCVEDCRNTASRTMKQLFRACDDIFRPEVLYDDYRGWQKVKFLAMFPPRVGWTVAGVSLAHLCYRKNEYFVADWENKCNKKCKDDCPGRALQSASSSRQVCEPPTPPKSFTPKPPPAPNFTEDPCWSCSQVGGQCCGPFSGDPATGVTPCACATPGVPCDAYGCG